MPIVPVLNNVQVSGSGTGGADVPDVSVARIRAVSAHPPTVPSSKYVVPHPGVIVVAKAASMPVYPGSSPLRPPSGVVGLNVPVKVALVMSSPNKLHAEASQSKSPAESTLVKSALGIIIGPPTDRSTVKLVIEIVKEGEEETEPPPVFQANPSPT